MSGSFGAANTIAFRQWSISRNGITNAIPTINETYKRWRPIATGASFLVWKLADASWRLLGSGGQNGHHVGILVVNRWITLGWSGLQASTGFAAEPANDSMIRVITVPPSFQFVPSSIAPVVCRPEFRTIAQNLFVIPQKKDRAFA